MLEWRSELQDTELKLALCVSESVGLVEIWPCAQGLWFQSIAVAESWMLEGNAASVPVSKVTPASSALQLA